ncbi:ankyrin repeat protein [Acanthamoeba polyphaga moumouvirus]|uniref:Ankyrin repeat protein n=3 Tax=Moumouvirus TaxID=3080801 RepID=L7RD54_9VIRU|nr:ankyrin repeat protein [Acanthamoeba polyphaga moumouvirus]AGC02287.1 ankyrin repeat protein [Acanthamoeba polyphaga moumouvirus]AQN68628.1 ankyrin repeat protein [Saudi moumouvirus]
MINNYNINASYPCLPIISCKQFTELMHIIINHKQIPDSMQIINNLVKLSNINAKNENGWTALMIASANTRNDVDIEIVKLLLKSGADINSINNLGETALMICSQYSNIYSTPETVKLLLEYGANPNIKSYQNLTALILSCMYSNTDSNNETVEILLNNGADVNLTCRDNISALYISCGITRKYSNINTIKLLIKYGADINIQEFCTGWTPLILACNYCTTSSTIDTVRLLMEYGADINIRDKYGINALFLASIVERNDEHLETVKMLIDAGANVNIVNYCNCNPLLWLARTNRENYNNKIIKLLLDAGSDYNLMDNDGKTLLDYLSHDKEIQNIIYTIENTKNNKNIINKKIKKATNNYLYKYGGMRYKLLSMKWYIYKNNLRGLIKFEYLEILDYLCINDTASINEKVLDAIKWMD